MTGQNEKKEPRKAKLFSFLKTALVDQDDPAASSGFWKIFTGIIVGGALLIIAIFAYFIYGFVATEVPPSAAPPGLTVTEPGPAAPAEAPAAERTEPASPEETEPERQLDLEGLEVYQDDQGVWRSKAAASTHQDEVYQDEDGVWRNRAVQPEVEAGALVKGLDPTLNFLLGQVLTDDQLALVNTVAGAEPSLEGIMKLMTGDQLDSLKSASAGLDPATEGLGSLMTILTERLGAAGGLPAGPSAPAAGRAYVETGRRRLMIDNSQSPAEMVNEPIREPFSLEGYEQFDPSKANEMESPWETFEDPR